MGQSRVTDTPVATAASNESGPKRYRVVFEMLQVLRDEVEIEADTLGQAQTKAQAMIHADALGHLEFQALKSTEYRISRMERVR